MNDHEKVTFLFVNIIPYEIWSYVNYLHGNLWIFFVSNSLTIKRPRGAFVPKNIYFQEVSVEKIISHMLNQNLFLRDLVTCWLKDIENTGLCFIDA